jgi:hypothetical protein
MKDIKTELDELINLITYHEAAHIAGEPVTDEIRELLVEMLEVTKRPSSLGTTNTMRRKNLLLTPRMQVIEYARSFIT